MENPETEKMQPYEEMWDDVPIERVHGVEKRVCVVMETALPEETDVVVNGEKVPARGVVVRLGQYVQGIIKVGEKLKVERWQWGGGGRGWVRILALGDEELQLACARVMQSWADMDRHMKEGEVVMCRRTLKWRVVEKHAW